MNEVVVMNNKLREYQTIIRFILQCDKNHCVICKSKAGLGKTRVTLDILDKEKAEYVHLSGISTPLQLYKMLYDYNGITLVLDDMEELLMNKHSRAILKSALWDANGTRKISYISSKSALNEYPEEFDYTGKIIMLVNTLGNEKDVGVKALLSRTICYDLTYNEEEMLKLCIDIIRTRQMNQSKEEKAIEIAEKSVKTGKEKFNLRYLDKLIKMVEFDRSCADELFHADFTADYDMRIIYELMKMNISAQEKVRMYMNKTGKTRRTYYRKLQEVK